MAAVLMIVAPALTSCGAFLQLNTTASTGAAAYIDDLYAVHDRAALAEQERIEKEAEAAIRAENERRIAAMVASSKAAADIDYLLGDVESVDAVAGVVVPTTTASAGVSNYNSIYVDDYSSAYARRLQGFSSLTYRLPSSYYDYRYGDAYFLTLAYDPAFYTVMIVGDQVWVEPRYITNMFGSWNNPYYYGYHYGYNPYYYGYSYGYYDYWGWNSPYWGCDPYYHYYSHLYWHAPHGHHPHHSHHPGYHHPHHKPSGPGVGDHRPPVVHRPSYGTGSGSSSVRPGGGNRPTYSERIGGRDNSRGATLISVDNNGGGRRPGSSSARPGTTVSRPGSTPIRDNNTRGDRNTPIRDNNLDGGRKIGRASCRERV